MYHISMELLSSILKQILQIAQETSRAASISNALIHIYLSTVELISVNVVPFPLLCSRGVVGCQRNIKNGDYCQS